MLLWHVTRADSPLIVSVPHAGRHVPDAIALRLSARARDVPDTDWHVDELYRFAPSIGATLLTATHSRYVVDLNRDPSGKALYPGADNTELCPTRTFCNEPVYRPGEAPSMAEIDARRATYFDPYHALLAREIDRVRDWHGYAMLVDGHSIASEVPRFFAGRLPDLNLGTGDGASCDAAAQALAAGIVSSAAGFTHVVNGRFKGGWTTRHHGAPEAGIHAIQMELAMRGYLAEPLEPKPENWPPRPDPARLAHLQPILKRVLDACLAFAGE